MGALAGFISHLKANAGVAALVGDRVEKSAGTGWAAPYVLVRETFHKAARHLRGSCNLHKSLFLVRCFGLTWASAEAVSAAVYAAIGENGFTGTWDGDTVQIAHWDGRSDAVKGGQERNLPQVNQTLNCWYRPA